MAEELPAPLEFNAHDVTRIWNIALVLSDEDSDLRERFIEAIQIYREITEEITAGLAVDDGELLWVSEREVIPGGDVVRFRPHKKPVEEPEEPKKKGKKGGKAKKTKEE